MRRSGCGNRRQRCSGWGVPASCDSPATCRSRPAQRSPAPPPASTPWNKPSGGGRWPWHKPMPRGLGSCSAAECMLDYIDVPPPTPCLSGRFISTAMYHSSCLAMGNTVPTVNTASPWASSHIHGADFGSMDWDSNAGYQSADMLDDEETSAIQCIQPWKR
ncbi:hypothetical protein EJB05_47220, partial [Eragrostis curvula]